MMPDVLWKRTTHVLLGGFFLLVMTTQGFADSSQAIKKTLFQDTEKIMLEADSQKTRFFAPNIFNSAVATYQSAENDYAEEKSIREINEKLSKAGTLFRKAMVVAEESEKILGSAETARMAAHKVMASKFKPAEWSEAEEILKRAVTKMEKGQTQDATALASEAEQLYRQVERDTVAFSYMVEIREKLRQIESMKAGEYYAPKTYQKALALARQAEEELVKQPYGNEQAKGLIKEAMQQVDLGLKMSQHIKVLVKEKKTFEDLYLESLIPLETLDKKEQDKS